MYSIISPERAYEYVKENYAKSKDVNIITEVYYDNNVITGYFIPCYRFYVETEKISADKVQNDEAELAKYDVICIPMIDVGERE